MTYEKAAYFAQTWGMLYAGLLFALVLAYALWPKNREKFDRAASMPLDEEIEQ
jgi:cytochrome c oxidase cbb3-type subunit 4